MAKKYAFIEEPPKGEFGRWVTANDYFVCFTDNRATAVRWYKEYLKRKNGKK